MRCFFFFLFSLTNFVLNGQISGHIYSNEGDTLSFASIYVKGSSVGTHSNLNGAYKLSLDPGIYEIIYQYVGYQSKSITIEIGDKELTQDVYLDTEIFELQEITVTANGEDPAYPIIREAIKKRKYYRDLQRNYACKVYVKGNQKIISIPEKILGQEIGDLDGMLDSTRSGIVYLSETLSNYYVKEGESKEVIVSSKVSGDDNGYSFNSAQEMEFNVYDNSFELNRKIVSPIASNALSYYRYKLEGSFYEDGNLINKIKVLPKRSSDPSVEGFIYIIEDLWNIHSINVNVPSSATQLPFLDSLVINQIYVPLKEPDVFKLFSNTISFELKFMGVHLDGKFSAIYSDYQLEPAFEDGIFNNEIYKVEKDSNKKSHEYWDSIRPVPLTLEEDIDYIRKDSLQLIKESPEYLDSVDRERNKFNWSNILFGYNYQNSKNKTNFSVGSIFENLQYNTIQGYAINPSISYSKYFDEAESKRLRIKTNVNYGFTEERFRITAKAEYLFNKINFRRISIEGGQQLAQYNNNPAITTSLNSLYTTVFRRNWAKFYNKEFIKMKYQQEIVNGIYLISEIEHASRDTLTNQSFISYFYKDSRTFMPNILSDREGNDIVFENNQLTLFSLDLRFRFDQKFYTYPDRKFTSGSKYPDLWLHFDWGSPLFGADSKFIHLAFSFRDDFDFGVYGHAKLNFNMGTFFGNDNQAFIDYKHFNTSQILINNPEDYTRGFMLLSYYDYSTNNSYFQAHFQYHFDGYILDKIPLFNKLGWRTVIGAKYLHTDAIDYNELHVGIDNIGFGIFRIARLDLVWSFEDLNYQDFGMRLGIGFGG